MLPRRRASLLIAAIALILVIAGLVARLSVLAVRGGASGAG